MNRWVGIARGRDSAQYGERKHFGNFPCINVDIILRHSFLRVASQNPLNLPTLVQKKGGGGACLVWPILSCMWIITLNLVGSFCRTSISSFKENVTEGLILGASFKSKHKVQKESYELNLTPVTYDQLSRCLFKPVKSSTPRSSPRLDIIKQ